MGLTLRDWIREHRVEIDEHIAKMAGYRVRLTDTERYQWVTSNEWLIRLAKREGVRLL